MCEEVIAALCLFNKPPLFVALWIYSNAADLGLFVNPLLYPLYDTCCLASGSLTILAILSLPVDLGAGNVGLRLGEEDGRE